MIGRYFQFVKISIIIVSQRFWGYFPEVFQTDLSGEFPENFQIRDFQEFQENYFPVKISISRKLFSSGNSGSNSCQIRVQIRPEFGVPI